MFKGLFGLLLDADEPPKKIGWPGFAILAAFAIFCAFVWFNHAV